MSSIRICTLFLLLAFSVGEMAQASGPVSCQGQLHSGDAARSALIDGLVKKHLPEVENLFGQIVRKFPMEESEYVFVGRSPSLLAAYLEVQSEMYTKLHSWVLPVSLKYDSKVSPHILQKRFRDLIQKYRPSFSQTGGSLRRTVVIDVVAGGRTFKSLEQLFNQEGIAVEFAAFTFDVERVKYTLKSILVASPFEVFEVSEETDFSLAEHKFFAPYGPETIEREDYIPSSSGSEVRRPEYLRAIRIIQDEIF